MLDLLTGRSSREDVADRAVWLMTRDDEVEVDDEVVWRALTQLSSSDLQTGPQVDLHTEPDDHAWLDQLGSSEENPPT